MTHPQPAPPEAQAMTVERLAAELAFVRFEEPDYTLEALIEWVARDPHEFSGVMRQARRAFELLQPQAEPVRIAEPLDEDAYQDIETLKSRVSDLEARMAPLPKPAAVGGDDPKPCPEMPTEPCTLDGDQCRWCGRDMDMPSSDSVELAHLFRQFAFVMKVLDLNSVPDGPLAVKAIERLQREVEALRHIRTLAEAWAVHLRAKHRLEAAGGPVWELGLVKEELKRRSLALADALDGQGSGEDATMRRPARIYVASRASVPERGQMWRRLRSEGVPIVSSWIDEDGPGRTVSHSELWERIAREIASSDLLILYVEPEDFPLKGALIEVGMALALGLPVRVVAPGVQIEVPSCRPIGSWLQHPNVIMLPSVAQAVGTPIAAGVPNP